MKRDQGNGAPKYLRATRNPSVERWLKRLGAFQNIARLGARGTGERESMAAFAILKPKFGEPCNQCGWCCAEEACSLSVELLQSDIAPCIALERTEDGKFHCGLLRSPEKHLGIPWRGAGEFLGPMIVVVLGIGKGCCSDDPSAPPPGPVG